MTTIKKIPNPQHFFAPLDHRFGGNFKVKDKSGASRQMGGVGGLGGGTFPPVSHLKTLPWK